MNPIQTVPDAGPTTSSAAPTATTAAAMIVATPVLGQLRIAVVSASWHHEIVAQARGAVLSALKGGGIPSTSIEAFDVPGAFEIPLQASKLAQTGRYDAIIACALVVNGGIYRHEFVAAAVIDALMRVQLDSGVPVLSAVLTPRDFHEHDDHRRFFSEHFVKKGTEVAQACLQTIANHRAIAALPVEPPNAATTH
jgi:6,7-dimethyl-8-ribityllumazine synthase